jgi:hypothetical protein
MPAPYSVFHRLVVSVSCSHMRCPVGALRTPHLSRGFLRLHEAAAGSGRSEHRNVDILIPLARQRESPTGPNVPCERRTDPAEPRRGTDPQRQPWHSAAAKQVWAPGGMRRSFRTHRLCAIPGVSPRAGIGVGMAVVGHPSLRTGRADFPHPALQSVSHPLAAGLVRSARAKAYREISPRFSKNALG